MSSSVLISVVTFAVIGCAILAAKGFQGRVDTIGVDLGTTFSVVGVKQGGSVQIVQDNRGRSLVPSVVSFLQNGRDVIVGHDALARLNTHPRSTIFNSKRFIGRSWEEDSTQEYGHAHPYHIVQSNSSVSNYSTVAFSVPVTSDSDSSAVSSESRVLSPEDIGTYIIEHLKALTAEFLGHSQVTKAVIAVPAKFTSNQRAATGAAYKAAGLKVVRVIEEPTAAAVAYKLHTKSNVHHILVYDFGGGTLDVSILYVAKGAVSVYATDGDDDLGGSDFDMCLRDALLAKIDSPSHDSHIPRYCHVTDTLLAQLTSTKSTDEVARFLNNSLGTSFADLCSAPTIRQKSEDIKKALTWNSSVNFSCDALLHDGGGSDGDGDGDGSVSAGMRVQKLSFPVTREFFESSCAGLFARGLVPVTRLLDELGMLSSDIDEVVMVGGSTRIPLVKQQLREYFGGRELNDRIDPDVTVAYGAASILD